MSGAPLSWPEIQAWRRERRAALLEARQKLAREEHQRASSAIVSHLEAVLEKHSLRRIGIYWPIRREIDLRSLATRLIAAGGEAALPVIVAKNQPLEFRPWHSGATMASGIWDIPYPAEGAAVVPQALLVPLVGYDEDCFRLGYGGGYYDRTIPTLTPKPLAIGLGFAFSRLATIYPQSFDQPMDMIVTEAGVTSRARPLP
jgi:5-formyltetrahydrofolate cyclo-ligase